MPLARIRTEARELALDLAEELYELGYTVETISPAEYREKTADLEIQLEACDPDQLISLVANVGEKYKKIFLAEGVIDRLPWHAPAAVHEQPLFAPQPIAFVEDASRVEAPEIAPPLETVPPPNSAAKIPAPIEPVLTVANSNPYAQQSTGRTRRVAELVASVGTTLGRAGLFVSDKFDDTRERLAALRVELEQRMRTRLETVRVERKRAAELAAAAALKRKSEREARLAAERTLQPEPVVSSTPKQNVPAFSTSANVRASRVRSRLAKAHSAGRQLRNSPAFALKFGTAVGLMGMVLLIAYANRRAPSPVGLGELTRSTTVQQSAPFGSAEIKAASAQSVVPGTPPSQQSVVSQAMAKKNNAKPSVTKPRAPQPDDSYDEPEVVVRHHTPAQRKPVVNTAKDDGIKRFSDLD